MVKHGILFFVHVYRACLRRRPALQYQQRLPLNVCVDYAVGYYGSQGVYVRSNEAF
jgi:hypothetical protein